MSIHDSIREVICCVERRNGITMRRHITLEDLARSLLYRWPEDDRGAEWMAAQKACLSAMEGNLDPAKAREAFVAAANAAGMLMVREEYLSDPRGRSQKKKRGTSPMPH